MNHPSPLARSAVAAPPPVDALVVRWLDEAGCAAFAGRMAAILVAAHPAPATPIDASIELHGGLGAGKTTFARHLLRALGTVGRIKSPTYAVLEPHATAHGDAAHLDFFRFDDPREWDDAGLRDVYATPGLRLAEWPEKAAGLLPPPDLALTIDADADDTRRVRLEAGTARGAAWLEALRG